MSFKDLEFKGRSTREQAAQTESNTQALGQIQNLVMSLLHAQFQAEQRLKRMENLSRISDYRSLALQRLLTKTTGLSEADVTNEIMEIQVEDFDRNSTSDDLTRGLSNSDSETAANGHIAILSIGFYDANGSEMTDERIVRSKITLGEGEIFGGAVDSAVVGLTVGESRRFELTVGDAIKTAEVTLIGLRSFTASAEETPAQEEESSSSEA